MPRYYFHFSDGNRVFTDENGLELIDFADVKQRVIRQVRDLKSSFSRQQNQDWANWKLIVVDAKGTTILEVSFDLKPKPLQ